MINRRAWIRRSLLIGTAGVGAEQLWRHGHDYVFPSQFVVVEPGKIFRGAWQKPWPMRRIVTTTRSRPSSRWPIPPIIICPIQERELAVGTRRQMDSYSHRR